MKIEITEWNRFWKHLGTDWCMSEHDQIPEDTSNLDRGEFITITEGLLQWKDIHKDFVAVKGIAGHDDGMSVIGAFRRWKKLHSVEVASVLLN